MNKHFFLEVYHLLRNLSKDIRQTPVYIHQNQYNTTIADANIHIFIIFTRIKNKN